MLIDLHVLFICATLALVLYADEQGLLWMLGKKRVLNPRLLEWLHALIGVGLACIITTGGLLIVTRFTFLLTDPIFIIKMVFVAALILNGFFISYVNKIATHRAWSELSREERLPLLISGALSMGSWAGALICGLLLH